MTHNPDDLEAILAQVFDNLVEVHGPAVLDQIGPVLDRWRAEQAARTGDDGGEEAT